MKQPWLFIGSWICVYKEVQWKKNQQTVLSIIIILSFVYEMYCNAVWVLYTYIHDYNAWMYNGYQSLDTFI